MAAPDVPDIDGMDWSAGSIPLGTQEAEEAQTALVRAVVEVNSNTLTILGTGIDRSCSGRNMACSGGTALHCE